MGDTEPAYVNGVADPSRVLERERWFTRGWNDRASMGEYACAIDSAPTPSLFQRPYLAGWEAADRKLKQPAPEGQ